MAGIKKEGRHQALVYAIDKKPSSKGHPMLTLTWKEVNGENELRDYYAMKYNDKKTGEVKENTIAIERLAQLKLILGLVPNAKAESFLGKEATIVVKADGFYENKKGEQVERFTIKAIYPADPEASKSAVEEEPEDEGTGINF